jgi:hypothetical protein
MTPEPMQLDPLLTPALESGGCPHMAVMLGSSDELYPVLSAFYALGVKRNGWIAHRALPGESDLDRQRLREAGLDVDALEAAGQFVVVEFDPEEDPVHSTTPWREALERALERGYTGLWYSRFAIGQEDDAYAVVVPFELAWDTDFTGEQVVTLCPYIANTADSDAYAARSESVAAHHDQVLITSADGRLTVQPGRGGASKHSHPGA